MLFLLVHIFPITIVFKILFPIFQSILKLHSYVVIVVLNLKGIMPNLFGNFYFIISYLPSSSYKLLLAVTDGPGDGSSVQHEVHGLWRQMKLTKHMIACLRNFVIPSLRVKEANN